MTQIPEATLKEIDAIKKTLDEFLGRKFTDQSILLGLNNNVQGKFQTWILSDSNKYHSRHEKSNQNHNPVPNNQLEIPFSTIHYFEKLWIDFHYPIIKYYQHQHASFYSELHQEFEMFSKGKNGKQKSKFTVKPVEIRKLYDQFSKFLKQTYQFYSNLLRHFSTRYQNPLIPDKFLKEFNFEINEAPIKTTDPKVQANFVFLIHRCLLSLGNISRHRSFIELTYVNPCLSNSNFWKYRNLTAESKSTLMKPFYKKALKYYKLCILLLPALNEPYNHIGMIYNLIDNKYEAIYWFLRSQFTRIPNYKLGFINFLTILKKKFWFTDQLLDYYDNTENVNKLRNSKKLNAFLICMIGYYYMPEIYHNGSNIVKDVKFSKVETDFFNFNFEESLEGSLKANESVNEIDHHFQQLIVLISFHKLVEDSVLSSEAQKNHPVDPNSNDKIHKFNRFIFRYIDHLLNFFKTIIANPEFHTKILICSRLILNWIKENKLILRFLHSNRSSLEGIANLVNLLLDNVNKRHSNDLEALGNKEDDNGHSESQDSRLDKILELLNSNSRPIRNYYFPEDVILKDFSIIKFQFKDFKDDHLFESGNINLFVGDYSSYCTQVILKKDNVEGSAEEGEESQESQLNKTYDIAIPSFLDNSVVAKINKIIPTDDYKVITQEIIGREILHYEIDLRIQAICLLGKKVIDLNNYDINYDPNSGRYTIKNPEVNEASQTQRVNLEVNDSQNKLKKNSKSKATSKVEKKNDESRNKRERKNQKLKQKNSKKSLKNSSVPDENSGPEISELSDMYSQQVNLSETPSKESSSEEEEAEEDEEDLDLLQSVIRNHTSKLQNINQSLPPSELSSSSTPAKSVNEVHESERESGLINMVDSLVHETTSIEPNESEVRKFDESSNKIQIDNKLPSGSMHSPNEIKKSTIPGVQNLHNIWESSSTSANANNPHHLAAGTSKFSSPQFNNLGDYSQIYGQNPPAQLNNQYYSMPSQSYPVTSPHQAQPNHFHQFHSQPYLPPFGVDNNINSNNPPLKFASQVNNPQQYAPVQTQNVFQSHPNHQAGFMHNYNQYNAPSNGFPNLQGSSGVSPMSPNNQFSSHTQAFLTQNANGPNQYNQYQGMGHPSF